MEMVASFLADIYINKRGAIRSLLRPLQYERKTLGAWNRKALFRSLDTSVIPSMSGLSNTITGAIRDTMQILTTTGVSQITKTRGNISNDGRKIKGAFKGRLSNRTSFDSTQNSLATSVKTSRKLISHNGMRSTSRFSRSSTCDHHISAKSSWRMSNGSVGSERRKRSTPQEIQMAALSTSKSVDDHSLASSRQNEQQYCQDERNLGSKRKKGAKVESSRKESSTRQFEESESESNKCTLTGEVELAETHATGIAQMEDSGLRGIFSRGMAALGNKTMVISGKELSSAGLKALRSVSTILEEMPLERRLRNIEIQDLR